MISQKKKSGFGIETIFRMPQKNEGCNEIKGPANRHHICLNQCVIDDDIQQQTKTLTIHIFFFSYSIFRFVLFFLCLTLNHNLLFNYLLLEMNEVFDRYICVFTHAYLFSY